MNYSLAFSFVKDEKDWIQKLLITGLIALIPIVGILYVAGWLFEISRRVMNHEAEILPEVNFSKYISVGFKACVISFVYMLPCTVLNAFSSLSNNILSGSNSDAITFIRVSISCGFGLLGTILGIALSLILIAAYIRFLDSYEISSAFNFSAVWKIFTSSTKDIFILWLFNILAAIIASVGVIFCFIGIVFTVPYASATWGHLLGQLKQKLG